MNNKLSRVWEVNEPYPEVLSGTLTEDIFAASLSAVKNGNAPSIYQDPNEFFEKTYVTEDLKVIIRSIAQKLNNTHPEFNSVYKLETSFGGGKTHCLIALYHTFSGKKINSQTFNNIIGEIKLPLNTKVVCIDGADYDPIKGNKVNDGFYIKTLWGDLAYQIDGIKGYNKIKENDERQVSPGAKTFEDLFGNRPILILIDEIANYLNKSSGVIVGESTLAKQTITFLFDLLASLATKPNIVIVLTLASSQDAFSNYTAEVNSVINEALSVISRKAKIVYPTKESEIYGVIRRRLFKKWENESARNVIDTYFSMYEETDELSHKYKTIQYKKLMLDSYPFHPELIDILETRISSFSNFQRTRGALRLLARVISDIWQKKEKDIHLILPAYVGLDNPLIRNELTGKLQRDDFLPVIQADIANDKEDAKAQIWDKEYLAKKLPPLPTRMANVVYLYSLIIGEAKGMDKFNLLGSILTPGINPSVYFNLLERMEEKFWYFRESNGRYFFNSEPTINKIIQDYMSIVESSKVRARIRILLEKEFSGSLFKTIIQPNGPSDVKDDDELKLIVLDYKYVYINSKDDKVPKIINQIWNTAKDGAPRIYKNTTYFVIADLNQISRLETVAREYEAYRKMEENKDDLANLSPDQREKLEAKKKDIELSLKIALANTYRFLYFPRNQMEVAELDPSSIGESRKSRQRIIYEILENEGKIKNIIKSTYAKSRAWPTHQKEINTITFKNWFYQNFRLPIPTKIEVIRNTIKDGIKEKLWVYYDGKKAYVHNEKLNQIVLSENEKLILLEEAIKRNLCNVDGEKCSKCKEWPCQCQDINGKNIDKFRAKKTKEKKDEKKERERLFRFRTGLGSADLMVKKLREKIQEENPTHILELEIQTNTINGTQSFITLFIHLPECESIILDSEIKRSNETPNTIKKIQIDFSGEKEEFIEFYNSFKSFIESKKLSIKSILTLYFNENTNFSIIDKFLSNLQNYSIEYDINIKGKIMPQ
ncbi:MAG: ATP-binding protein [Promethearchaeia archaeon]